MTMAADMLNYTDVFIKKLDVQRFIKDEPFESYMWLHSIGFMDWNDFCKKFGFSDKRLWIDKIKGSEILEVLPDVIKNREELYTWQHMCSQYNLMFQWAYYSAFESKPAGYINWGTFMSAFKDYLEHNWKRILRRYEKLEVIP